MNEEELKKGCGKEFYLKQTSKKKSLCNGFGLCSGCQARLEGFQKGKLEQKKKEYKFLYKVRAEYNKKFGGSDEYVNSKLRSWLDKEIKQLQKEIGGNEK